MKVLKNNLQNVYPKRLICEGCGSELEYEKSDERISWLGCVSVKCPVCERENFLDDEGGIKLTIENIEFPVHFHRTSIETGAVEVEPERIKHEIQEIVRYFRDHKNELDYSTQYGDSYIHVHRYEDDEEYNIIVYKDYYETVIPFEKADYPTNSSDKMYYPFD